MIEDFDNTVEENDDERRWADEEDSNGIIGWLKRQCTWRTLISPALFLVFVCGLLWYDRETVDLIIKLSYGDVLFRFIAISFILVLPLEYLFVALMKALDSAKRKKGEVVLSDGNYKTIFIVLYLMFIPLFYDKTKGDINQRQRGPQYSVVSFVSDCITEGWGRSRSYYIEFKIEDKRKRIKYDHWEWEKFKIGDKLFVTYQIGCLNWIVYNEIRILDDKILNESVGIAQRKFEHGEKLTPGELDSLLKRMYPLRERMLAKDESKDKEEANVYGRGVEKSLGEYLKERLPAGEGIVDGWTEASFTIDGDGNVHNVKINSRKTKASKALHKALTDMGKWIGKHEKGKKEKVKLSLAYLRDIPNYLIVKRVITSDDGSTLEINDEYDMNYKKRNVVVWTAHEEK